jgi:outer membrane protein OmpU
MKKLLLGTSLASALLVAASAYAEVSVGGSLETTINTRETATTGVTGNSSPSSIGHETDLNLRTKKELDNGMTLTAGFDINNSTNEDQFVTLTSGSTSFSVGNDVSGVADNVSQEDFTPYVAQDFHSAGTGGNIAGVNTAHGANGIFLKHAGEMATVEGVYSPSQNATNTTGASSIVDHSDTKGSGYDLAIHGSFGVEGLKVGYGISKVQSDTATENDQEGTGYGIKYAMGDITIGAGKTKNQTVNTTTETNNTTYGVTYNVNDQLSVGVAAGKHDNSTYTKDEEYQTIQVGYDLGGMVITAGYYQVENVGGTSGSDNENLEIRTVTKF